MKSERGNNHGGIEEEMDSLRDGEKKLLVDLIRSLRDIRYGHVQITVHDSAVTQIDKTEKLRIDNSSASGAGDGTWRKKT